MVLFKEFTCYGGTSYGPIASSDYFYGPVFSVNVKQKIDCSNPDAIAALGLVVNGYIGAITSTSVRGSVFVTGNGEPNKVFQSEKGCVIRQKAGTGDFNFNEAEVTANTLSFNLQSNPATLQMSADGTITRKDIPIKSIDFLFFQSCVYKNQCDKINENLSDSTGVLEAVAASNYAGLKNFTPNKYNTYVWNVNIVHTIYITLHVLTVSFSFPK